MFLKFQFYSLREKAVPVSARARPDAAGVVCLSQQSMAWMIGVTNDPSVVPHTLPGEDVLEGQQCGEQIAVQEWANNTALESTSSSDGKCGEGGCPSNLMSR